MYNHDLMTSGFSNGAGGFGIDVNGGILCQANQVVTADAQAPSAPPPIAPTRTATLTPLPSNTPTVTPTPVEDCLDGIDNDADGLVDCDDAQSCHCEALIRDPAHLCPKRGGLFRYTVHARVRPVTEIDTLASKGITISLQYHGGAPWARFTIPPSALHAVAYGRHAVRYRFSDRLNAIGIKKWSVRKVWQYGQLLYLINGNGMFPAPPEPGRTDIVQQINLGDRPFVSRMSWTKRKACLVLNDYALAP